MDFRRDSSRRSYFTLDQTLPTTMPLGKLLKARRDEPEFARLMTFAGLFERFHLKHTVTDSVDGREIEIDDNKLINYGSFNYLGLEQHPEVIEASKNAIDRFGTHSGCSRVFSSHANIVELERALADLVGAEAALIGHNVSQIHAGVLPALFSTEDSVLFLDRHAHTSIYLACQIAKAKGARVVRVDVADPYALKTAIKRARPKKGALLVDGVYSMQGNIPDLLGLDQICRATGIILYVDDAHGVGVFGKNGGGVREACGLSFDNLLLIGSLQKALGTYGGFVAGREALIHYLRMTSRSYIFSGTLQPAAVDGALVAVRIARSEEGRVLRAKLAENSRRIRRELTAMGYLVPKGDSPIIPVLIGADIKTFMAGRKLYDLGIYLNSVLFPAVPHDGGILRISLTALHGDAEIKALLDAFRELKSYLAVYENPVRGAAHVMVEVAKSKWQGQNYVGL